MGLQWKNNSEPALNETNLNQLSRDVSLAYEKALTASTKVNTLDEKLGDLASHTKYITDGQLIVEGALNLWYVQNLMEKSGLNITQDNNLQITNTDQTTAADNVLITKATADALITEKVSSFTDNVFQRSLSLEYATAENWKTLFDTDQPAARTDHAIVHCEFTGTGTDAISLKVDINGNESSRTQAIDFGFILDSDNVKYMDIDILRVSSATGFYFVTASVYDDFGYNFRQIKKRMNIGTSANITSLDLWCNKTCNVQSAWQQGGVSEAQTYPYFGSTSFNWRA